MFEGHTTMCRIKMNLTFASLVFIQVESIFPYKIALHIKLHISTAFSDFSSSCVWLHLVANTGVAEFHTLLIEVSKDPNILIHVVSGHLDH